MNHTTERRVAERYKVRVAVSIESGPRKGRLGLSVDASVSGVLFRTTSRLEPGEEIALNLYLPDAPPNETRLRGKVVRVADDPTDAFWRHLAAVRFDGPAKHIERHLSPTPLPH